MNVILKKILLLIIQLFYDLTAKIDANIAITELKVLKLAFKYVSGNYYQLNKLLIK